MSEDKWTYRPILSFLQEQITEFLKKQEISEAEIPRLLDVIKSNPPAKSKQLILSNCSTTAFHALVALGIIALLTHGEDLCDEDPNYSVLMANALDIAVPSFIAGFNFAHVVDEEMVQSILAYNSKFLDAGKRPRNCIDALDEVLENIVAEHFKANGLLPTWRTVIQLLKDMEDQRHPTIQEVEFDNEDEGRVFWKGRDTGTPFKRIQKRLTAIRKKYK